MITKDLVLRPYNFHHEMIKAGDLRMHVVVEGPENGPLVVLLHGFPEFWYGWRHQIKMLASAGYRVAAPDQRGYNLTEKRGPYDTFTLTEDVINLIHALGYQRAFVVGHDWGGAVAWQVAAQHPDVVGKLVVCNCPHILVSRKILRTLFIPQMIQSMYIGFFQLPWLPEKLLSANNFRALARAMQASVSPGKIMPEEIGYYREAWAQPGAITGGLNWYRNVGKSVSRMTRENMTVSVPTRLIWGTEDVFLNRATAEWSREWCPNLDIRYLPGVPHFVQLDAAIDVNRLITSFFSNTYRA